MPERLKSFLVPCIAAAASVGTALLLTLRIPPPPGRPFMLFLAAVAVSSRFGGRASGVLATLLSGAAIYWWLLPPFIHGFHAVPPVATFIVVALLLTSFSRVKSETARREEADAGLRASEQRFRSAFAHSAVGMALTDLKGHFLDVNESYCALTGYTREELARTDFPTLTHPDDLPSNMEQIDEMLSGKIPSFVIEKRYIKKNCESVWVRNSVSLLRDSRGNPENIIALSEDVTARKGMEAERDELLERERAARAEAEASRQRIRNILEGISDHFVAWDREWRCIYANRLPAKLRKTREEILGKSLFELFPDAAAFEHFSGLQRAMTERTPVHYETFYAPWDTWFDVNVYPTEEGISMFCLDITDRKKKEEQIRFQAHLLDAVEQAVIATDPNGAIAYWNRFAERLYGWRAAEVAGRQLIDVIGDAEAIGDAAESMKRGIAGESSGECLARRKDGATFPMAWFGSPIRDPNGAFAGVVAVTADITDRKQAEEALENRARQQAAVARLGQVALSGTGIPAYAKILELLPAGDALLLRAGVGWKEGSVGHATVGTSTASQAGYTLGSQHPVVVEDLRAETRFKGPQVLIDHGVVSGMSVIIRGSYGPFGVLGAHATQRRKFTADDVNFLQSVANVLAAAVDRQRAEDALRVSQTRFRRLVDSNIAGIAMGDLTGRLFEANQAFLDMVGYTPRDLPTLSWDALTPPEYRSLDKRASEEVARSGFCPPREKEFIRKDGSRVPVLIGAVLLEGLQQDALFLVLDLTERKRAEAALREREEQLLHSRRMEAVGQLAGGVAHDFNNLLTVVSGGSEILLSDLDVDDPRRADLQEIRDAGERGATLTQQLLAFSRRQVLQPKVLDLNALVSEVAGMLRRLVGEDIELVLTLEPGLSRVKADPGQMQQVLMNLAVNARDAMPEGGAILIETRSVNLDEQQAGRRTGLEPGPHVMLAASDIGSGISPETLPHIFEPFFTTKDPGKGTGLGLATVYGIVSQSAGYVEAISQPGKGARFEIYLPAAPESAAAKQPAASPRDPLQGTETVLLVEDDRAVRRLAGEALRRHGYTVLQSAGGLDAIAMAGRHPGPIHLLLTDVVMPQMNGRELSARLERIRPETRTLFVSGYVDNVIVQQAELDAGGAFLQKPFTGNSLTRKVREVLDANAPPR